MIIDAAVHETWPQLARVRALDPGPACWRNAAAAIHSCRAHGWSIRRLIAGVESRKFIGGRVEQNHTESVNKPLVGVMGAVCLVAAAVCYVWYPEQTSARSAFVRIGIVMTALYFALPQPGESVMWGRLAPIIAGSVVLIVLSKKIILVALPMLLVIGIVLAIFRPRSKFRPPRVK